MTKVGFIGGDGMVELSLVEVSRRRMLKLSLVAVGSGGVMISSHFLGSAPATAADSASIESDDSVTHDYLSLSNGGSFTGSSQLSV